LGNEGDELGAEARKRKKEKTTTNQNVLRGVRDEKNACHVEKGPKTPLMT